jgi:hypothetical protein
MHDRRHHDLRGRRPGLHDGHVRAGTTRPSTAIYAIANPLFDRARAAGHVRPELSADDVMRVIFAVTGGIYRDEPQRQRALQIVLDGMRPSRPSAP